MSSLNFRMADNLKSKIATLTILSILFILGFNLSEGSFKLRKDAEEKLPIFVGCQNPEEGEIKFKAQVRITDAFYKHFNINEDPKRAVQDQLKYLLGYLNYDSQPNYKLHPKNGESISILSIQETNYGRDLNIDYLKDNHALYPANFPQGYKVKSSDPSWIINYEASVPVLKCTKSSKQSSSFELILPNDPYLAYWYVSPSERKNITFFGQSAVMNPCSYGLMTRLIFPSMYWYVWNPNNQSKDFNCQNLLEDKIDYQKVTSQFKAWPQEETPSGFEELGKLSEIKAHMIFGFIDSKVPEKSTMAARKILQNQKSLILFDIKKLDPQSRKEADPSLFALAEVLKGLSRTLLNPKEVVIFNKESMEVKLEGELKHSKKKLILNILLGSTSRFNPSHWTFLKEGLESSELIFYVGHSGMGLDMNFATMKQALKLSENEFTDLFKKKKYQMLSIVSCYSLFYYGPEYQDLRKINGNKTDQILVSIGTYPFKIPLGILSYIDGKMVNSKASLHGHLRPYLVGDDVVTFSRETAK